MLSDFGAPIIEGFSSNSQDNMKDRSNQCIHTNDGRILCEETGSSSSDTSDPEEAENNRNEERDNQSEPNSASPPPSPEATTAAPPPPDVDTEESTDEDEDDDDDDDETPETTNEAFFGGKIEHFSNKEVAEKATSMNTVLKAVMITCLFYVLAHKDAKKFIMGNVFKTVNTQYYLYIAMVIFFIVYYIISVFL